MPKRQLSPLQQTQTKLLEKIATSSDSNLLRIPLRQPSQVGDLGSIGSRLTKNATWGDNTKLRKTNLFFNVMMESEGHALNSKIRAALQPCVKDLVHLDEMSMRSCSVSPLSQASPLSDNAKVFKYAVHQSESSHKPILSSDLRTTLINELTQSDNAGTFE
jgi:hypothetical protein